MSRSFTIARYQANKQSKEELTGNKPKNDIDENDVSEHGDSSGEESSEATEDFIHTDDEEED